MKNEEEKLTLFDYIEAIAISGIVTSIIVSRILKDSAKHTVKSLISKARDSCKK